MTGKLHAPSDAQWEAIKCTDEHVLINAGAGTGKTFTVVAKALYLMGVEIRGETVATPLVLRDIAAITYTTKAAAELKEDLRTSLRAVGRRREAYQVDSARVGTIHSFCTDILREFALRRGGAPDPELVGEAESKVLRAEVVRDTLLGAVEDGTVAGLEDLLAERSVKEVQSWVSRLVDHGDQLERLIQNIGDAASGDGAREASLIRLAQMAHEQLVLRLASSGRIDYDRMVTWTRDLLRDDATVRKALQRRIRVLIIDECQDLDPVQREIAYLLADPTRRRSDTTRLVLVGDPKQSIYRFRKADVTVWHAIEQDIKSNGTGRVVALNESRRSISPVLAFVDHFVGSLLDTPNDAERGHAEYEVPYAPLSSLRGERAEDATADCGVEFMVVPATDAGKCHKAEIVRRSEARAIAERVCELHGRGHEWRDIAVLLCGWGASDIYSDALREAGVPTYALRTEGFYGCREVLDILVALGAVHNPGDDRMLFGMLRSPFVGLSDESLLHIVRQTGKSCWSELASVRLPRAEEQAILEAGIDLVRQLSGICDRVSVAELMEELLGHTGYLAHLELLGDTSIGIAKQRIANVAKLVSIAGAHPEITTADFLRLIERERELEVKEGEARLYGERDDVVTITSVHSAKGLEWRCVIWADLMRGKGSSTDRLLVSRDAIALGEPDISAKEQRPEWQAVRAALDAEHDAETKRLWYVAATRARDLLILSGIPLGTGVSAAAPASMLKECYPEIVAGADAVAFTSASGASYVAPVRVATVVEDADAAGLLSERSVGDVKDQTDTPFAIDVNLLSHPLEPVTVPADRSRHSATELMAFARCERRHWFKRIVGLPEPRVSEYSPGNGASGEAGALSAAARGSIIHDVLEHFEDEVDLGELVDAAIGRQDDDESVITSHRSREREKILAEISETLSRPEYRTLLDAPGARRELPFTLIEGSDAFDGQIDLIAPDAAGYRILDVKTGGDREATSDEIARKLARYELQRTLYTHAVETITGAPVNGFTFDFSASGVQQDATLSDEARAQAEERLAYEAAKMKSGARELSSDGKECRYCGYRSAGWCAGVGSEVRG